MIEKVLFSRAASPDYVCRIPSVTVTPAGTLLAFAGLRHGSAHDFGHKTEMVTWRSTDGGDTWSEMEILLSRDGYDIHTGPVLVDRAGGRLLKFCRFWPGDMPPEIAQQFVSTTHYEQMVERGYVDHLLVSDDDGETWGEPRRLPLPFPEDVFSAATGNGGHGVQLGSGRLLVQGGYSVDVVGTAGHRRSCILLSEDGGETWRMGAHGPTSHKREFLMAEVSPDHVYLNFRNSTGAEGHRMAALSRDGGQTWGDLYTVDDLPAPKCHGGIGRVPGRGQGRAAWLALSLPDRAAKHSRPFDAATRRDMTVWLSKDGGETWPEKRLVHTGPAGYSDLAVDSAGVVHLVYERGTGGGWHGDLVYVRVEFDAIGDSPSAQNPT